MTIIQRGAAAFGIATVFTMLSAPDHARAQTSVSPSLPPDHWAVVAAARAEALGLAPDYLPAQRSVPRAAVAAALEQAAALAPERAPALEGMTAGWLARLRDELAEHRPDAAATGVRPLGGGVSAGAYDLRGRLAPGAGIFHLRTAPAPIPDERTVFAGAEGGIAAGDHLAAHAEAVATTAGFAVPRWEAVLGTRSVSLSVGRQRIGYGNGAGGGVVLGAGAPLARVQLETTRPLRLPGLAGAGDFAFHTFATRLTEARHRGDPWLWGARVAVRPHRRFTVALNRAAIFGGDSIATPTDLRSVGGMLIGLLTDEFENQVVSLDLRWRLPTDAVVPLTAYLEWGADDASGSWWRVPGIVAGLHAPALPGLQEVAAGLEYATFAVFCCGNPPWYFNASHPGGWAAGDALLGHPLAGDGREGRAYADATLAEGRVHVTGSVFVRHRDEAGYHTPAAAGNLLGPDRFGSSRGGSVGAALRPAPRVELRASGAFESGRGWSERRLRTSAALFF